MLSELFTSQSALKHLLDRMGEFHRSALLVHLHTYYCTKVKMSETVQSGQRRTRSSSMPALHWQSNSICRR